MNVYLIGDLDEPMYTRSSRRFWKPTSLLTCSCPRMAGSTSGSGDCQRDAVERIPSEHPCARGNV